MTARGSASVAIGMGAAALAAAGAARASDWTVTVGARAQAVVPYEGAGRLAVTATQNAATVFVDEDKKGVTPIPIDNLKVGRHGVRVSHDGFFDWRGEVYVDPTETTSVWAQLKERPQAWYQKWWVWTIAGAVVVGATVTAVAVTRPPATVGHGSVTLQ